MQFSMHHFSAASYPRADVIKKSFPYKSIWQNSNRKSFHIFHAKIERRCKKVNVECKKEERKETKKKTGVVFITFLPL